MRRVSEQTVPTWMEMSLSVDLSMFWLLKRVLGFWEHSSDEVPEQLESRPAAPPQWKELN